MVCMSYPGTLKMVEKLCEDHDVEVQFWCDDLKRNLDEKLDEHTVLETSHHLSELLGLH